MKTVKIVFAIFLMFAVSANMFSSYAYINLTKTIVAAPLKLITVP